MHKIKLAWIILLLLVVLFFISVRDILLPFIVGILVGYLLDPFADWLELKGLSRTVSTAVILLGFFLLLMLAGIILIPLLIDQLDGFIEKIPNYKVYLNEEILSKIHNRLYHINPDLPDKAESLVGDIISKAGTGAGNLLSQILESGLWLVNLLSLVLVTPVIAFYILRDWDKLIARGDALIPEEYAGSVREYARRIDNILSGFIRGQLNVCLILGLFYSLGLTLVGLNFGFLIGIGAGILTFIPYAGTFFGTLIGVVVSYVQFDGHWLSITKVAAVFIVGQFIEGNFITPKLVGDKIKIHPAWLIFGVLAGGSLLGAVGVLLALPVTAVTGTSIRFALEHYEKSKLPEA